MSTITPTVADDTPALAGGAPTAASSAEAVDALDAQVAALQSGGISLMETREIALKSLTANKRRTLLTALGIITGVAAVVALMAIGNGSQATITANITANGANLLTVRSGARVRWRTPFGTTNPWRGARSTTRSSRSMRNRPSSTKKNSSMSLCSCQ
jgi:hypothetical protein